MALPFRSATWVVVLLALALFLSTGCKPDTPPNRASQTGALVSPRATATLAISPLPTPVATSGPTFTPYPTPWPPDFTPSPAPLPSPTPEGVPYIITDTVNQFTITVLPGWYVMTPDPKAVGGVTSITTYDMYHIDKPPIESMEIQIFTQVLDPGQSFEDWLSIQRARQISPDYGASGITLTEVQPYMLGSYTGVAYTEHSIAGKDIMIISLLTSDRRIVSIDLKPAAGPMLPDAQTILSTLKVFPMSSL